MYSNVNRDNVYYLSKLCVEWNSRYLEYKFSLKYFLSL